MIFKENQVCFTCFKDCASLCCSGATLLTASEISNLSHLFPITVHFNKISPQNEEHKLLLDSIGINRGRHYIVGDFVAGNWRDKTCSMLNQNKECKLHLEGIKPIQCIIVPFDAIYPESLQGLVIVEQRAGKFFRCQGFKDTKSLIWEKGHFKEGAFYKAFRDYHREMGRQRDFMDKLLGFLKKNDSYKDFVSGRGILESPIIDEVFDNFVELVGFKKLEINAFIKNQMSLLKRQVNIHGSNNVFADALEILKKRLPKISDSTKKLNKISK